MAVRPGASAALRSQRRFLIIVSIAVAAYYYLEVHIKGEGEYSGLAVRLGRATDSRLSITSNSTKTRIAAFHELADSAPSVLPVVLR